MSRTPCNSISTWLDTGTYRNVPPDVRMELLGRVAEIQSALFHIKIVHNDPYARKVVVGYQLENDEAENDSSLALYPEEERPLKRRKLRESRDGCIQTWHVRLIDFRRSVVLDLPNAKFNLQRGLSRAPPLPPNLMTVCRGSWPLVDICVEPRRIEPRRD
ncbi:hypothetical protein DHEL01_v212514 [Diaporthe helianthi]|uniref:Uncharacterized protein n=1 Tax=Diaporthe helianthi TaxID=158607 RepID=A0A2P5HFR9_DIAHE|nr:hypothetical protein DHEL01_v212514 [Diaporthe helianthi]